MDTRKLKELEDLKIKNAGLSQKIISQIETVKQAALDSAREGFIEFFRMKGFVVTGEGNSFAATYGSTKVSIQIPNVGQTYVGTISRLDLTITGAAAASYVVPIDRKGYFPTVTTTISTPMPDPRDDNERLQREIDKEAKRTQELESDHEAWRGETLVFGLFLQPKKPGMRQYPQYPNFQELLGTIFN